MLPGVSSRYRRHRFEVCASETRCLCDNAAGVRIWPRHSDVILRNATSAPEAMLAIRCAPNRSSENCEFEVRRGVSTPKEKRVSQSA